MKNNLLRIHFISLAIVIINYLSIGFSNIHLRADVFYGIKIIMAITGIILFFIHLKPFKKINIYFSIYSILLLSLLIGIIFRGFLLVIILTIVLFPFMPGTKKMEENGIVIYTPFKGFLSPCCYYEVKERKLILFEKDCGDFKDGQIDENSFKIIQTDHSIEISYELNTGKSEMKTITFMK